MIAAVLSAFATYTYFSVRFVWPAVLLGMTGSVLSQQLVTTTKTAIGLVARTLIVTLVIPLVMYSSLLIPMIKSPLYADSNRFRLNADSILKSQDWPVVSNQWREIAGNTPVDRGIFHRHWLMLQALLSNYSDNLSFDFLFMSGDPNLRHGTSHHGLFLWFWLPTLPLGLLTAWRKSWLVALGLISWWIAALLPASVPENTPHALRTLNALLPLSLLMAVGAATLWEWASSTTTKGSNILACGLKITTLTIMVMTVFEFTLYYNTSYQKAAAASWQTGFAHTMAVIEQQQAPGQVALVEHADDKFFLWKLVRLDFTNLPSPMVEQQYLFRQIGTTFFGQIKPADIQSHQGALTLTSEKKLAELTTATNQTPTIITRVADTAGDYILASWP